DEMVQFIEEETLKANRNEIYISAKSKVKGGVDFKFTSNKFLRKLGKRLKEVYGGDLKENVKLFSQDNQTGKKIYRLTVMFRPCPYKKGEIITFRGDEYIIMAIGKKIQAKGKNDGKRTLISFDDLR
ncbi:MAG: hypothetical protein KAQ83_04630, partial [Nanoarchaeota archaeon]|nr:hypothetical protein [Nanoarchaeota archaeon]